MNDKPVNFIIIGDCVSDTFYKDEEIIGVRDGGALFVRKLLTESLEDLNSNHERFAVDGYKLGNKTPRPGITKWNISDFNGTYRCNSCPRANQRVSFDVDFKTYETLITPEKLNSADIGIIVDLSVATDDIDGKLNNCVFSASGRDHVKELLKHLRGRIDARNYVGAGNYSPMLFVFVNRYLPRDKEHWLYKELIRPASLGDELYLALLARTVVVVTGDALRWSGIHISRQISWERTAQDFLSEWTANKILHPFHNVGHFIVRCGLTGMLYTYMFGERRIHRILFDPVANECGVYRDLEREGDVVGHNTIILCGVIREWQKRALDRRLSSHEPRFDQGTIGDDIALGLQKSILRMQKFYDYGFGEVTDSFTVAPTIDWSESDNQSNGDLKEVGDHRIPAGASSWKILTQAANDSLDKIGCKITLDGVSNTLNSSSPATVQLAVDRKINICVPVIKFGGPSDPSPLIVIDRREIESYRTVRNMMKKKFSLPVNSHSADEKPLTIAIFGPPGAGKSFVIDKIVASAAGDDGIKLSKINMANLTDEIEFYKRMKKIQIESKDYPQRVLFLDEFDSKKGGTSLGWLQFLIALIDDKETIDYFDVLVFAGGTSYAYSDFCRNAFWISDAEKARFREIKGPDFVSRLRGHINILGPNRIDVYDDGHVIRRALILRSILKQATGLTERGQSFRELIDQDVVLNMLRVGRYRHGARSMEAIIDMWLRLGGEPSGKFVSSTLPTSEQVAMHIENPDELIRGGHGFQ